MPGAPGLLELSDHNDLAESGAIRAASLRDISRIAVPPENRAIYPAPCKSHDRPTRSELSWDYRGICPSQRNESAVPLALQTEVRPTLGKEPAAGEANPVGDVSGDMRIGLASFPIISA